MGRQPEHAGHAKLAAASFSMGAASKDVSGQMSASSPPPWCRLMFLGSREAGTSVLDPCHMTAVEMFPDTPNALCHHMDQNGMGKKPAA